MAHKSGNNTDQLIKVVGNLTESVASMQASMELLRAATEQQFKEQTESRMESLRMITGRVATIGNQLSYFRETVCGSVTNTVSEKVHIMEVEREELINYIVNFQRNEVLNSIEDRYRKTRDALRKSTKHEITVMRDLFIKAHPDLFKHEERRPVIAADPPPAPEGSGADQAEEADVGGTQAMESSDADKSPETEEFIPPAWCLEVSKPEGQAVSEDELKSIIAEKIPFDDDIDIWEILNIPGGRDALIQVLNVNLPEGIEKRTDSPKFADHIIFSLLSDSYTEDHTIPPRSESARDYSPHVLPPVPKEMLSVLQGLAEVNKSDVFDVNTFWKHVRQHFPDVSKSDMTTGTKPTATSLLQQAQAAVSEEEQALKAAKTHGPKGYEKLLVLMQEYRSSGSEESPDPPVASGQLDVSAQKPGDLTVALGAGLDTTIGEALRMEHRTRKADETNMEQSGSGVRRKRSKQEETATVVEVKKSKGDQKKK